MHFILILYSFSTVNTLLGNDAHTALGIPITIKEKSAILTNTVFIALSFIGLSVFWKLSTKLMAYSIRKVYH